MSRMLSTEEFKEKVKDLWGNKYLILSPYRGSHEKIHIKFCDCGHDTWIEATRVVSGTGCKYCANNVAHNTEWYKQKVKQLCGDEYVVKSNYINNHTPVKLLHTVCNHVIAPTPKDFIIRGSRCEYCSHKHFYSYDEIVDKLLSINYQLLINRDDYLNTTHKYKVKHLKCGYVWEVSLASLIKGHQCPRCSHNLQVTFDMFIHRLNKISGNLYSYISGYEGLNKSKVLVKCNKCGRNFKMIPSNLLAGHGCPICTRSRGEDRVALVLDKNNIDYETQKAFPGLRYKQPLFFDFYIPKYNLCIEYDGKQHTHPVKLFDKTDPFEVRQRRDHIKNVYCKEHSINLLRIPYNHTKDIEDIIMYRIAKL